MSVETIAEELGFILPKEVLFEYWCVARGLIPPTKARQRLEAKGFHRPRRGPLSVSRASLERTQFAHVWVLDSLPDLERYKFHRSTSSGLTLVHGMCLCCRLNIPFKHLSKRA